VMSAFTDDPANIRVVIVGQDPYPTDGVAIGRAFAIGGDKLPASLRNIFTELAADEAEEGGFHLGNPDPSLAGWQNQGVFLLNRHLTTVASSAGAHFGEGWELFTDAALRWLLNRGQDLVLVLWGAQAQQLGRSLATELREAAEQVHLITGVHPSPLSAYRGFFGSRPFSAVNRWLSSRDIQPIDWYA